MKMKSLFFTVCLLAPAFVSAETATPSTPNTSVAATNPHGPIVSAKTTKLASPSSSFREMASSTAQSTLYFFAGLFVVYAIFKRFKGQTAAPSEAIEVVARKALSQKGALVVAEVEGRRFLLAQNGDDITLLTTLEPQDDYETDEDFEAQVAAPFQKLQSVSN